MKTLGERIRWALARMSRNQSELAAACGVSRNAVGQWVAGRTQPTDSNLKAAAAYLKVDLDWLVTGQGEAGRYATTEGALESSVDHDIGRQRAGSIVEIDIRMGAGQAGERIDAYVRDAAGNTFAAEQVRGEWSLPPAVMREYLRTTEQNVRVFEVVGDSMEPRLYEGDRVFIDVRYTFPSPEGIFALFDGYGLVIKRLQIVDGSDPLRIRILSINTGYAPRERLFEEIKIVGRLAGRFTVN